MSDPDMGAWSYTYDAAGNLVTQTDARGVVLWFGYDGLKRVTQKRLTSGSGTPLANYTYDDTSNGNKGIGRRTGMSDSSGITSWVYDVRGRLVQESKFINGAGGGTFVTQWSYDSADRMTQMVYPGNEGVNFVYNDQGLLRRMYTTGVDYVRSAAYDEAGRVTQRVLGSSTVLTATYTYFPWTIAGGRLQRMTLGTTGAPTSLQDLTYSYDAVGNVQQQLNTTSWSAAQKQCFSYDGLNRLTAGFTTTGSDNCTGYTGVGSGPYNETTSYSPNGNLSSKSSVGSYVYGASSPGNCRAGTQATKPHAVMAAGSNSYSYDCNGNMIGRTVGGVTYSLIYDAENRLQQVKQGSAVLASYTYDADGNRVTAVMGSSTTVYVGAYYEKTTSGGSTTITKYYQAGGQRVAMRVNGVLYWLATDHLGSTSVTASEAGVRVAELRYKPWGESRYTFGVTPTQRRFTGQMLDNVAGGLYFYNARYYDPSLGRFAQADTIVPNPGNPQSLNRYTYAANNPILFTDQQGHFPTCVLCASTMMIQAHVWNPLFGTGPDIDGLRVAQDHQDLIDDYATADAPAITLAAGIAVQSQWMIQDVIESRIDAEASLGIAQMTSAEMRKYVGGGSALDPDLAIQALSRKIGEAVAACTGCSTTDKFIVAGVAQNGRMNATEVSRILKNYRPNDVVDWHRYFEDSATSLGGAKGSWLALRSNERGWDLFQVQLFLNDLLALQRMGWQLPPDLNIEYIQCLAVGSGSCPQ
jgi:RHS repeat-associated protein